MARIGPHGLKPGVFGDVYICPGGEVRAADYFIMVYSPGWPGRKVRKYTGETLYICQTCHCVVPASEVQE